MRRGRYGQWLKHLDLFDIFEDFRQDQAALEGLAEADEDLAQMLSEGSGAPEGRVDFPIFLQTVIRHKLRQRFDAVAAAWDQYLGIESAQDFREHTVSSLGAIRGVRGVLEHGEYPRLRTSEEIGPSFAVGKYGGIYAVTYELTINDDTNEILNRIPAELGRSMGEYVNQVIAAFIESNPTYSPDGNPFFDAVNHDNNITGASATVTEDNAAAMIDKLTLRRDDAGVPINTPLRRILVRNPSRAMEWDRIIRSQQTGVQDPVSGGNKFFRGNFNPLSGQIPGDAVIQDVWLNDPDDYYLLADAQNRPPFVAAFLRGRRDPYIFLNDPGMKGVGGGGSDPYTMDYDEIPYKIRHVFGVAAGEPKAAIRVQP